MKRFFLFLLLILLIVLFIFWIKSCFSSTNVDDETSTAYTPDEQAEFSPRKDEDIQRYNLGVEKQQSGSQSPCDTLAVKEYVLNHYPAGTYLVDFDKTTTYNVPKPAVVYYNDGGKQYIFGVVARSKPGERLIEPKNIVGYNQSFINLDSTELGTAFFYLTLFECQGSNLSVVWEAPIPDHGGLNTIRMNKWINLGTPYVSVNFHYARGIGHIDYNYFLINGITNPSHLLMTYKGINYQRTIANINGDQYPDYYEYIYYDYGKKVELADSVAFLWSTKDSLYYNTRNKNQTRPY